MRGGCGGNRWGAEARLFVGLFGCCGQVPHGASRAIDIPAGRLNDECRLNSDWSADAYTWSGWTNEGWPHPSTLTYPLLHPMQHRKQITPRVGGGVGGGREREREREREKGLAIEKGCIGRLDKGSGRLGGAGRGVPRG